MPRLRHGMAATEGIKLGKEELPQLVRQCSRPTDVCDNHVMALSSHGLADVPSRPVRRG
jgi:hypothetical protein